MIGEVNHDPWSDLQSLCHNIKLIVLAGFDLDYRFEDCRFQVPTKVCANQISETGVKCGIRSWKFTFLNAELDVRKPLVVSILLNSEELRLYNLV
jgi:hypothetical protein